MVALLVRVWGGAQTGVGEQLKLSLSLSLSLIGAWGGAWTGDGFA